MDRLHTESSSPPLPTPAELRERFPLDTRALATVTRSRTDAKAILRGEDDRRLLLIVGPCSLHDEDATIQYARRLGRVAQRTCDALVIVMRTYVEKPRTRGGWRGMVYDPYLDESEVLSDGLIRARRLLSRVASLGVPPSNELLGPNIVPYFSDVLGWAAIGARTTEAQPHRELASGLRCPVGVKNATDGSVQSALDAISVIRRGHTFAGIGDDGRIASLRTAGNAYAHVVLRGGRDSVNYDAGSVRAAAKAVTGEADLRRPIVVDVSHGNCQRDYRRQPEVWRAVLDQWVEGNRVLAGMMLESNLEEGKQPLIAGQIPSRSVSITDGCVGWQETDALIEEAAEAVRSRRSPRLRVYHKDSEPRVALP
jgi:3-deoxy-7-phosphoheptulonate synthase